MKQITSAFENFAFKAFNFNGRATLLEYWLIMPLIWGLIAFLLYGDAIEFWDTLLAKQIPTMNPLYWDGILVFLLTLVPRLSLTVRRLHDSGKNGKWAKLPFVTVSSGLILMLVLLTAMVSMSENLTASLGFFAIVTAIAFDGLGTLDSVWQIIFASAAMLDALGWDAIWALLSEITAAAPKPDVAAGLSNIQNGLVNNPAAAGSSLLVMVLIIAMPFITSSLHIFFMISPTKPDHELDSHIPMSGATLRKQGTTSDNPFASYKHLYEKTAEQKAAAQANAKQEIRSLYQQRVLGSQQAG